MHLLHHIPSPGKIGQDLGRLSLRPGLRWRNPFPMHHQPGEGRLRHQGSARRRWRELRCIRCVLTSQTWGFWLGKMWFYISTCFNQKSGGEIWKYWQRWLDWQSCVTWRRFQQFVDLWGTTWKPTGCKKMQSCSAARHNSPQFESLGLGIKWCTLPLFINYHQLIQPNIPQENWKITNYHPYLADLQGSLGGSL